MKYQPTSYLLIAFLVVALPLQSIVLPLEARAMMPGRQRVAAKRLSQAIKPELYDVRLTTDLAKGTFSGTETITIKTAEPTNEIWMHALDLKLSNAHITDAAGKQEPLAIKYNSREELAGFTAPNKLPAGTYKLRTAFSGNISTKLNGLYNANFTDKNGS
jgi:hypothetical protein